MRAEETASFGTLLRRYRKIAELTQEELAERAHLSVRGISDLERGARHSPRSDTLALLVEALGLTGAARTAFEASARPADDTESEPAHPPARAGRRTGTMPLAGRTAEITALERHLAGVGPPVFLLAGEPGIGKTRLLTEAAQRATQAGYRVLTGSGHHHEAQMAFAPLLEALQSYLRTASPARLRAELEGCAWLVRLLPELSAGPIEPVPPWLLSPDQERRLMGQAVERFLTNIGGPAGVLLVLDDLQWAGADALVLLTSLIHAMGKDQLRVIGAYRETEVSGNEALGVLLADLAQGGLATKRRLGPLDPAEADELLRDLLPDELQGDDAAARLRERMLSRADGVPFFLVSCAQALQEGALDDGVPWDVAQGVRQRVAALPAPARQVLGVASVAERVVPRSLLLRVVGLPTDELLLGLEGACRSGLLAEHGEHDYEITHDVIREVVEADLGAARRTALHRQIALALSDGPGEPPAEAIAYHFARTDEHSDAAYWLEQAGDQAAARFALATAMERYLAACERAPAGGDGAKLLSRLHGKLGSLHALQGEFGKAREAYVAALSYAETSAPADSETAARRAELHRREGDAWEKQGEYAQALAAFDAAEEEGRKYPDVELPGEIQAQIALSRGTVYQRMGQNDAAADAAERAVMLLHADENSAGPAAAALGRAYNLQGSIALHRGDLTRAEALYRQGLRLRERTGDQAGSAASWNNVGRVYFRRGELTRAEECFQQALKAYDRLGDRQGSCGSWHNLGATARDRGDLARAEECYRRSLSISEQIGDLHLSAHAWHSLGIVVHDRGDLRGAQECFERSQSLAERIGDLYTSAHNRHRLGIVARDRGDLQEADECVEQSLRLFERLGDAHGVADCWATIGLIEGERAHFTLSAWRCRAASRLAHRLELAETEVLATLGQARARLRSGHTRGVPALLDSAQELALTCGLQLELTQVAVIRAELQLWRSREDGGAIETARERAAEALHLAAERGYRREEALSHRLLGHCALLRSTPAEAAEHLQRALELFTGMGAALEGERTRRLLPA